MSRKRIRDSGMATEDEASEAVGSIETNGQPQRQRRKVEYTLTVHGISSYVAPLTVSGAANAKNVGMWIKDTLTTAGHEGVSVKATRSQAWEF